MKASKTTAAAGELLRSAVWGQALEEYLGATRCAQREGFDTADAEVDALEEASRRWTAAEREIAALVSDRLSEIARLVAPYDGELAARLRRNDPPDVASD